MSALVPMSRRSLSPLGNGVANMIDDFFIDSTIATRSLMYDSFKMDVTEDDNNYYLEAEMPGIKKEELSIDFDDGRITISLVKDENKESSNEKNVLHRERRVSSIKRSVYLRDATEEGINAKLEDGILKLVIPKVVSVQSVGKQIDIM